MIACHPHRDMSLIAPVLAAIVEANAAFRLRICANFWQSAVMLAYLFRASLKHASEVVLVNLQS